jgi:hypothetical protein
MLASDAAGDAAPPSPAVTSASGAPDQRCREEPRRARGLFVLCTGLLVAACQTPPPAYEVERARSYAKAKQAVWDDLLGFLERSRIAVTSADFGRGAIVAERRDFEDQGFADCGRAWVVDNTSNSRRRTRARPVDRDLVLRVAVAETAGATEVTLAADVTEQQINPYTNLPITQRCRSTGVLERALLDAL